jgi:hypothetical protein
VAKKSKNSKADKVDFLSETSVDGFDSASVSPEGAELEKSEQNSDNSFSMAEVAIEAGSIDLTPDALTTPEETVCVERSLINLNQQRCSPQIACWM